MREERCLIIDFGSQYTQLIARRLREIHVFSEVIAPEQLKNNLSSEVKALILSGGPQSVGDADAPTVDLSGVELPVLGICYGMQWLAQSYGGCVEAGTSREYGVEKIKFENSRLTDLPETEVLFSHGDHVERVPEAFEVTARSSAGVISAIEHKEKDLYGLQFHPEVYHTPAGKEILKSFCQRVGFHFSWEPQHIFEALKEKLTRQVGGKKILCALSGGVDSSVAAVVLNKIFPGQVHCFCVDTGLLRKNELNQLKSLFKGAFDFPIEIIDAEERFLSALAGEADPEKKRKIIGRTFIEVFEEEGAKHSDFEFLAQGTLYPDVIESTAAHGGATDKIKSHHNVGGLPDNLRFQLVEPFRLLFKDEVRLLGEYLGIPHDFVWRHPFPGPGLAVRTLGPVRREDLEVLREADWRLQQVLKEEGIYEKLWQSFCVMLPVQSVGVMGDKRTYENVVAVRCVHSQDGMTAHIADIPTRVLERISSKIINEVKGINRVVYDISSKPPSTIEWE